MTGEELTADQAMRGLADRLPVPEFEQTVFNAPRSLADATVAIVTTSAIHRADDDAFSAGDTSYRVLDRADRAFRLGHWSPNFDRSAFAADLDVVYPINRLEELAAAGTIGAVAPRHIAFAGNQPDDVSTVRLDSGPAAARMLLDDGVDAVIFTPV